MNKTNFGIIIILIMIVLFSISKNNKKVIIENLPDGFKKSEIFQTKFIENQNLIEFHRNTQLFRLHSEVSESIQFSV